MSHSDQHRGPHERDGAVFDMLDRRYRPLIEQLAVSLRFSREDVSDIVQETLLDLFLLDRFRGGTEERALGVDELVYSLAERSIRARRRATQQRVRLVSALSRLALTSGPAARLDERPEERPTRIQLSPAAMEAWRAAA